MVAFVTTRRLDGPRESGIAMRAALKTIASAYKRVNLLDEPGDSEDQNAKEAHREARKVAICVLKEAYGFSEDRIMGELDCSPNELRTAQTRYVQTGKGDTKFAKVIRSFLKGPVTPDDKARQKWQPTKEEVVAIVCRETGSTFALMLAEFSGFRASGARDILAIILPQVTNMSEEDVESFLKREPGFVRNARIRTKRNADRLDKRIVSIQLRTAFERICDEFNLTRGQITG